LLSTTFYNLKIWDILSYYILSYTLVGSTLVYGSPILISDSKTDIGPIECVQNCFLKFLAFKFNKYDY